MLQREVQKSTYKETELISGNYKSKNFATIGQIYLDGVGIPSVRKIRYHLNECFTLQIMYLVMLSNVFSNYLVMWSMCLKRNLPLQMQESLQQSSFNIWYGGAQS